MEKEILCNGNQNKAGVAILTSDNIDLKIKIAARYFKSTTYNQVADLRYICKYLYTQHKST